MDSRGSSHPLCCFSRGGEFLASCSSEGELKVWDSTSGNLLHTFCSPHLQGNVTCISWKRIKSKTRKRQSSAPIICVGVGSKVTLWNLDKGEEENALPTEHRDDVTCVDWDLNHVLYSGSKDKYVVEWDVSTSVSTRKWKADKMGVQCLCCYGDGSLLITAGRAIKLWNLQDYSLLKKLTGHASSVNKLVFVNKEMFLSSASHDRFINVWCTSGVNKSALATLTSEEEVLSFSCCVASGDVRVASLVQDGSLLLHKFPSSSSSPDDSSPPVPPISTLQFVSTASKASLLPVFAVCLPPHTPHLISLAHSSHIRPVLETIDFDQKSGVVCFKREVESGSLLIPVKQANKSSSPTSSKVTVLGPGNMTLPTHQLPEKLEGPSPDLRPLSDRIEPQLNRAKDHVTPTPSANSMTQLLVQSVASGDDKLMEEVLRVSKEKIVTATVQRLPVHVVLPFMKKLIELLHTSPARGLELSLWIKTVLSAHAAYLMTVPQLASSLSGLYQLLEARVNTFSRLSGLQGKLELMLAQSAGAEGNEGGVSAAQLALTTPLLTVTLGEDVAGDVEECSDVDSDEHSSSMETDDDSA